MEKVENVQLNFAGMATWVLLIILLPISCVIADTHAEYHTDVEYHCQLIEPGTKYSQGGASETHFKKRECVYTFNPPTDHYEIFHYSFENLQYPEVIILPDGTNITGSKIFQLRLEELFFTLDNYFPKYD